MGRARSGVHNHPHVVRVGGTRRAFAGRARRSRLPLSRRTGARRSAETQRERFESYLQANRLRGFEPSVAPLVRLALFRTSDDSHRFVWSYHHLIMDGWSVPVLIREVLSFYEALTGGRELGHGPARPFGDYIGWLRRQDLGAAEGFWRAS